MSEVQQFYEGKNVLITGGTGFVGKVLIEKLLRCCPRLENLYILVRSKRGKDIQTRMEEVFDDPLFDRLKKHTPEFKYKVNIVKGNCEAPDLGLSNDDKRMLQEKINIIFHAAATVKFDEDLRIALAINVQAALHLLDMAKEMKHLKCFMQISTAYSNTFINCVDEKFYPTDVNYEELHRTVDGLTNEQVKKLLPKIMNSRWPNTYTFTKALAENELLKRCGDVPLCIFRPSIVISTAKEPIRSWVGNMYGPIGVVAGSVKGVLRTIQCDTLMRADMVPVDYLVNCLLVASLNLHRLYGSSSPPSEPPIFNFVCSSANCPTWGNFNKLSLKNINLYPSASALWYPILLFNKNLYVQQICSVLLQLLPAIIIDVFAIFLGKKPRMLKIYLKIHKLSSVLSYFSTRNFYFKDQRTQALWGATSDVDKKLFPFDMRSLDWNDYFEDFLLGIRRYILKESDVTIPQAQRKLRRLYYLHQISLSICFTSALYVVFTCVKNIVS